MVQRGKLSQSQPDRECLAGEWRRPVNDLQHQIVGGGRKSIHANETAAKIGFGAAPIHGTVHWSQFTPILLEAFGQAWFETGSISVHFKTPVSHMDPVRAFASLPASTEKQQIEVWMEHLDGRVVLEGTASVGLGPGDMVTMANSKQVTIKPFEGALVFIREDVGTKSLNVETARIDFDKVIGPFFPFTLQDKLDCITEWHPWFSKEAGNGSPWGRPILPPECLNAIMLSLCGSSEPTQWPSRPQDDWLAEARDGASPVGLFGGCEVIMHHGPVFVGQEYNITRQLVAKGETPKTEFSWVRTLLKEQGTGEIIAEMTLQSMRLKQSFAGDYDKLRAQSDAKHAAMQARKSSKL